MNSESKLESWFREQLGQKKVGHLPK